MPKIKNYSYNRVLSSSAAFTLVELLVVISIIGILAGVLIALLDPAGQQAKAKDGTIKATLVKAAFSLNAAKSADSNYPAGNTLSTALSNIVAGASCSSQTDILDCNFKISAVAMPSSCTATSTTTTSAAAYTTGGTNLCEFGVKAFGPTGIANKTSFRLFAKSFTNFTDAASGAGIYVFDSKEGLYECNVAGATSAASVTSATGDPTNTLASLSTGTTINCKLTN